jgi:cytochrome c oxidase subunit II
MRPDILWLPTASKQAVEVNWLLAGLLLVTGAVLALVFGLMILYMVRYRHDSGLDRGTIAEKTWRFETGWTAVTLLIFFGLFIWGADLYVRLFRPPPDALKIAVIGKQWMWKVEYPGGQREINTIHVPIDRPVELVMSSEDVIHDLAIPAFRVRHDVVPGRTEEIWFTATRPGEYHLFCDQLCGTGHSSMVGAVVAMKAEDYQRWLSENGTGMSLAARGRVLFTQFGCAGCHLAEGRGGNGTVRAPALDGLYGSPVPLADRSVVIADDQYIRDSILQPERQVVASYAPLMPSFSGVVKEEDLVALIAFIKSLGARGEQG